MDDTFTKYTITRDGESLGLSLDSTMSGLPNALFSASQHYGSGEYLASDESGPVFRLATEWLDEEES